MNCDKLTSVTHFTARLKLRFFFTQNQLLALGTYLYEFIVISEQRIFKYVKEGIHMTLEIVQLVLLWNLP